MGSHARPGLLTRRLATGVMMSVIFTLPCVPIRGDAQTTASDAVDATQAPTGPVVELPTTQVTLEAPVAADLTPATVTTIDPAPLTASGTTLADALRLVPGLSLRTTGGLGGATGVSLRGVGADNVALVLDDLPLTSASFGPPDLGLFPLEGLAAVEVYRGSAPARFQAPLGGVIRLVTRLPKDHLVASAHVGGGSNLARTLHGFVAGPMGSLRVAAYGAYQGTSGDFVYYDDRETPYTSADDELRERQNNALDLGTLRLTVERDLASGATQRVAAGFVARRQGVPGPGAAPALAAHASELELTARASWMGSMAFDGALLVDAGLDALVATRVFDDPDAEIGLGVTEHHARLAQLGADTRLTWIWNDQHETELAPRVTYDEYRQSGDTSAPTLAGLGFTQQRFAGGAGLEHRYQATSWLVVTPSVRADLTAETRTRDSLDTTDPMASPRLGAVLAFDPCELRANVGRYHRLPTPFERYGDGTTTLPSPDLLPERGWSGDAGLACGVKHDGGRSLAASLTGFASRPAELIAWVQSSQYTVRAQNVGETRIVGVESQAAAALAWVAAEASYTFTQAVNASDTLGLEGKHTPGVPQHQLEAALTLGPEDWNLRYELGLASVLYLDRANLRPVGTRWSHDVLGTARLFETDFWAKAAVHNLLNVRTSAVTLAGAGDEALTTSRADYLGYPLPGRTFFVSLLWRMS